MATFRKQFSWFLKNIELSIDLFYCQEEKLLDRINNQDASHLQRKEDIVTLALMYRMVITFYESKRYPVAGIYNSFRAKVIGLEKTGLISLEKLYYYVFYESPAFTKKEWAKIRVLFSTPAFTSLEDKIASEAGSPRNQRRAYQECPTSAIGPFTLTIEKAAGHVTPHDECANGYQEEYPDLVEGEDAENS